MAKKAVAKTKQEVKREPRSGWRKRYGIPRKDVELTEEELARKEEEISAERAKRSGPVRSRKKIMGGGAHISVRLGRDTLDWLAAEAQVKSTTVSQIVRAWIETKEKEAFKEQMLLIGRSE